MLALLQRVTYASVVIDNEIISKITKGLLVFLAIEANDTEKTAQRLSERVLGYRIFADTNNKVNLSVRDIAGSILIVPQFTLIADTAKGMRPSFTNTTNPLVTKKLFAYFVAQTKLQHCMTCTGKFGVDMQINLCNDGPATFILRTRPSSI